MNIYEFIKLNDTDKGIAICDGDFLSVRVTFEFRYALYSLGDFFVEVVYDPNKNKLVSFRPFRTRTLLEPYLNEIDISGLIN